MGRGQNIASITIYKTTSFVWMILLTLIFLRPFLSEYAFLSIGFWYILSLIFFSSIYLFLAGRIALFSIPLNFSIFVFLIVILISIALSGFNIWSLFELYLFIPNILIFYIVSKIKPEQQKQLIAIVFIAASIICIYAIYQYFFGFRHLFRYINQTEVNRNIPEFVSKKRVFATFISPNIFASYNAMMLFLGLGFLTTLRKKRKILHWVYISILIMAISLLLTKSLGGILVFFITFLLFLFCTIFYLLPNLGIKKIAIRKTFLGLIFVLFILVSLAGLFTRQRLLQFFNINEPNNSMIQRFYYWKASLNMIKDYPLITGIGWRRFGSLYEFYKPASANISHYSHNLFLQIMTETGLLGLLSFLGIVFLFLKIGFKQIKNYSQEQGLKIGLFCAGVFFLLHNCIDLSFYFGQVSFFGWVILGLFHEKI